MGRRHCEYHIHVPVEVVLEHIQSYYIEQEYRRVEYIFVPPTQHERTLLSEYIHSPRLHPGKACIVASTRDSDWTIIWSSDQFGDGIWRYLAEQTRAKALLGMSHTSTEFWSWEIFEEGTSRASDVMENREDQMWFYDPDRYPKKGLTVEEAFELHGRRFTNLSTASIIYTGSTKDNQTGADIIVVVATKR